MWKPRTRDEIENDFDIEEVHESENGFTIFFSGYSRSDDWSYELKLHVGMDREQTVNEVENFLKLLKLEVEDVD
jgi:hypothetical protein